MIAHITEKDVIRLLPMAEAIRLVEDAFRALASGAALHQSRRRLTLPTGAVLHQLAGAYGKYFGTKVYSTHVKHGAHFLVLLYDSDTAAPLAIFEANHLGQIRTGAASGVATKYLARPDATVLGVIGSGFQAQTQVQAIRAVREIREVRVYSRSEDRRRKFAEDVDAIAVSSAESAVRGADIIVTATFSKDPVLEADWIEPGTHINAIGSNSPQRRELPSEAIQEADLIAVDAIDQAKIESGDLLRAWPPEGWNDSRLCEMKNVVSGQRGRQRADALTIFKSNGLGVQDIAAAGYVYECLGEKEAHALPLQF